MSQNTQNTLYNAVSERQASLKRARRYNRQAELMRRRRRVKLSPGKGRVPKYRIEGTGGTKAPVSRRAYADIRF